VLDHENVHDAHDIRVAIKRKVSPEVRAKGRLASHAYDLLDDSGAKLRVIAHKLRDEDRSVLMTVTQDVSENVSDEGRKRGEHSFVFHNGSKLS
jgi:hypothetical protein